MLGRLFGRRGSGDARPIADTTAEKDAAVDTNPDAGDDLNAVVGRITAELAAEDGHFYEQAKIVRLPTAAAFLGRPDEELTAAAPELLRLAERADRYEKRGVAHALVGAIVRRGRPWTEDQLTDLVVAMTDGATVRATTYWYGIPYKGILTAVGRFLDGTPPGDALRPALERARSVSQRPTDDFQDADCREVVQRVTAILVTGEDDGRDDEPLLPGLDDPWAHALMEAAGTSASARATLEVATGATSARRTTTFTTRARDLVTTHGDEAVTADLVALMRAVIETRGEGYVQQIPPATGDVVRGLAWIAATGDLAGTTGTLADLAIAAWRKVPGYGALARKAGAAALTALAEIPAGAPQLARVRPHMKGAQAIAAIDQAVALAAETLGVTREELEERVVPHYGLDASGLREEAVGEHTAIVRLDERGKPSLRFRAPTGRELKSVPAAVRSDHPDELAALRAEVKDMTAMATAQRVRLERLLLDDPTWRLEDWRARYPDHPLVGAFARRLIWVVDGTAVLPQATGFVGVDGEPAAVPDGPDTEVRTWHPVERPPDEVRAWRRLLEERGVTQPFKQAHREVYLLTPAEEATGTYSNRFAAHVLRQHQMAALARERGWSYALQGAWDSPDETATLRLPRYGLTASFYVERPWATEDWTDSGVYNHVLSDQVRFDDGHETLRLDALPVRVLSEVLRDVDLFVGVTSIGNDPTWADQGDARTRGYWSEYAFGEVGASGEVRRDVLERLLPKLAIRDVAHIDGRFLVVRGTIRTYRIHLGSTNILMSPNDQYLCIVPARGADADPGNVYLPFEGDRGLALILSKAMMLAKDDRITDATIRAQIGRR